MTKPFTPPSPAARATPTATAAPAEFLDAATEQGLARAWQQHGDVAARNRLVTSHRALAVSVARRMLGQTGVRDPDLLQHAQLGLLKAADKFDPDRGFRFSTYAAWWVRAEIQDYRLSSWSLVRRGNSARMRKVFFNLGRIEAQEARTANDDPDGTERRIADELGLKLADLDRFRQHFAARDSSLNMPASGEDGNDIQDLIEDPSADVEAQVTRRMDIDTFLRCLAGHLNAMPARDRDIVIATHLHDPPLSLAELGARHGISRERVRQLRDRAMQRLRGQVAQNYDLGDRPF